MKDFFIQCKVRKIECLQFLGIASAAFLIGFLLTVLVAHMEGATKTGPVGSLFMAAGFGFIHLFGIMFSFISEFNIAVSMGATRKNFICNYVLFTLLESAGLEVVVFLFAVLEKEMIEKFFPQAVSFDILPYFKWQYLLLITIAFTVAELFCAALILRYGLKMFWGLWGFWIFISIVPVNLSRNKNIAEKLAELGSIFAKTITAVQLTVFGAVLVVFMAGVSWKLLSRQKVSV